MTVHRPAMSQSMTYGSYAPAVNNGSFRILPKKESPQKDSPSKDYRRFDDLEKGRTANPEDSDNSSDLDSDFASDSESIYTFKSDVSVYHKPKATIEKVDKKAVYTILAVSLTLLVAIVLSLGLYFGMRK